MNLTDSILTRYNCATNAYQYAIIAEDFEMGNPYEAYSLTNVLSRNNTFQNPTSSYSIAIEASGTDSASNNSFNKHLLLQKGDINIAPHAIGTTADSCVWQEASPSITNCTVTHATYNFDPVKYLLDSMFYSYHKWSSPVPYAGARKYLVNKIDTIALQSLSFGLIDSVAYDYRSDNKYYDTNFITHNTWYKGDSLMIYLETSLNKSTITIQDSGIRRAGFRDTLNAAGLSGGTKVYYRLRFYGLGNAAALRDTMLWDSVTTVSTTKRHKSGKVSVGIGIGL
jgi:hypothetical protein